MSKRYWCPQFCHRNKGWIDLPGASYKKSDVDAIAECIAQKHLVATRSIRKPHNWKPKDINNEFV